MSSPGNLNVRRSVWSHQNSPVTSAASRPNLAAITSKQNSHFQKNKNSAEFLKSTLVARYGSGNASTSSKKPVRARSATNIQAISPTPNHRRDNEDIMEDVLRLKRQIQTVSSENSMLKTKLRKLEMDLSKKDKELDDLLDPVNSSNNVLGNATSKGVQQRLLTQSLKQKIVRLEQAVRSKEATLNALKSDLKTTHLEELRVQSETMYHEILRLRQSQENLSKDGNVDHQNRTKSMQETILRLNESNQKLLEENKSLHARKSDQPLKSDRSSGKNGTLGIPEGFSGMKRAELVGVIQRLEKELANRDHQFLKNAHNAQNGSNNQTKLEIEQLKKENDQLNELAKKMKKESDELNHELDQKEQEIYILKQEIDDLQEELDNMRKNGQNSSNVSEHPTNKKKPQSPSPSHDKNHNSGNLNFGSAKSKNGISEKPRHDPVRVEKFRRNKAAKTIQRQWKRHTNEKDEAIKLIGSAVRGHAGRRSKLNGHKNAISDNSSLESVSVSQNDPLHSNSHNGKSVDHRKGHEDDISLIGAAVRGHLTRKNLNSKAGEDETEENHADTRTAPIATPSANAAYQEEITRNDHSSHYKRSYHDDDDFYR